jgi:endonuclease YncB( thermonuclease family)
MIGFGRNTLFAGLVALMGCGGEPPAVADGGGTTPGPDPAALRHVVSAYDGDTIRVRGEARSIRIVGYDAPEKVGKCKLEKELALEAKAKLLEVTGSGVALERARDPKGRLQRDVDRYGRLLRAATLPDGRDLAQVMRGAVSKKHGVPLAAENWGERRTTDWCKVGARR